MTKNQTLKMKAALNAIRKKIRYTPTKFYRWSIRLNRLNHQDFVIVPYLSDVDGFGFISRHDAKEFLKDPEALKLLKEIHGITD